MALNVSNLSVDSNGRVSFSGLNSGIDFKAVIDSIITAKKIPVDSLQTQVDDNTSKAAALAQLKTLLTSVKGTLSNLRGAVSVGNVSDIFETKEAYASSSRYDGTTSSAAASLIGVTVTNAAPVGSHSIDILQTARAHKIATDQFSSLSSSLGFSSGDAFSIGYTDSNGNPAVSTVNLSSGDTLLTVRDRINAANKGTTATGVSASIVSVSATEHYLVLTKDKTGETIDLTETSGTPLQDLGIFTGASALKNELQAAQTAKVYADGLLDQTNTVYESDFQTSAAATPDGAGTITFTRDSDSAALGSISYTAADTLATIAAKINDGVTGITGVTASVVSDGAGVRLEITGVDGFSMSDDSTGLADLGIDNKRRVIERNTNTIDDLFGGITLSLFQAEPGTTINLDIERNLGSIKTAVTDFVTSYNDLRRFINDQRNLQTTKTDANTETVQSGLLFGSQALQQADSALSAIVGAGVAGVNANFSVLAQIGIEFIGLSPTDPLDANTLVVNDTKFDAALLNDAEDVKRLFSFDFTPSDPRVSLLGFTGATAYNAAGFTLNLQPNTGSNMVQYSEQLDNAYWTKTRSSVSADAIASPTGSASADGLIADATNNTHFITEAAPLTVTQDQTYTYSVYAKQGANNSARIQLSGSQFSSKTYADVNLATGTITSQGLGADDVAIEDAGNGWYRISVTGTATATGNATMEMYSMNGINTVFTGDGSTVDTYFYGAQLEPAAESTTRVDTLVSPRAALVTSTTQADPYGNLNSATEIIADATNADHPVSQGGISVTSGESYQYVAYLHAGDESRAKLSLTGTGFAANTNVTVRLDTGAIVSTGAGADSAQIESVGGGWYRVTLDATATSTSSSVSAELRPVDPSTGLAFVGDGVTANTYVYDMKLIPKSSLTPSDYVATTNAAVVGVAASANVDGDSSGVDDGSVTVRNNVATVNTGDATGLQLFFDGYSLPSSVTFNYTVGAGAQMFFAIDKLLNESTGLVETEISGLQDTNKISESRITEMLARIEIQRQSLTERFINMETALATANRILDGIKQTTDAMFASKN